MSGWKLFYVSGTKCNRLHGVLLSPNPASVISLNSNFSLKQSAVFVPKSNSLIRILRPNPSVSSGSDYTDVYKAALEFEQCNQRQYHFHDNYCYICFAIPSLKLYVLMKIDIFHYKMYHIKYLSLCLQDI